MNKNAVEFPLNTIHFEFEKRVENTPDNIAVVYQQHQISYRLLNKKANQLANYIRLQHQRVTQRELSGDTFIGLCMDRGIDMVISILAILKAGAAYLPLDPSYPEERLSYILNDAMTDIVITKHVLLNQYNFLKNINSHVICVDSDRNDIEQQDENNLTIDIKQTDLAYIIYTSGSTGRPKGVMIEHKGVVNLSYACAEILDISSSDNILQFASINFDVAANEIFQSLLNGAILHVISEELRKNPDELIKYIANNAISCAFLPSALLRIFPQQALPKLTRLGFGGDVCDQDTANFWMKGRSFFNLYGPTEITVCATYSKLTEGDPVNRIGKALNNYKLYVLDKNLSPVPVGVLGELYIGGVGLARGYLNRPDLTVERFIVNPFTDDPAERIYKTGDVVRWSVNGELEYIGRSDFQVQIRGFRVELGEIEEMLNQYNAIKQAAVIAIGEDLSKKMVAYYVPNENQKSISVDELRKYLHAKLPDYMIPSAFIEIEQMPISPSGKIDRKVLHDIDEGVTAIQSHYIAPRNEIELQLVQLWSELFNHQKIGIRDDFFSLGGNSLLSLRMLAQVKAHYNQEISLTKFFQHPTIESLSEIIMGIKTHSALDQIVLAERDTRFQAVHHQVIYPNTIELKHILLTGANGFLGAFLLKELLELTSATIHCVVRGKNSNELKQKMQSGLEKFGLAHLLNHPRINLLKGDLSEKHIGMEDDAWNFLIEHCDVIYHNGSLVNHIYTYQMLKPANVNSTIELIQLATTGKSKLFNYISTISAANQFDSSGSALEMIPTDKAISSNGYQLSKWVSECILTSAAKQGLKLSIFRPGNITGDTKTGVTNFENNNMLLLLKSCIQLGIAPAWETHIEMLPVNILSHAIIKLSLNNKLPLQIFNMANHHRIQWCEYFRLVNSYGYPLELISPEIWVTKYLSNLSEDNALYPLRELYLTHTEISQKGPEFRFENTNSQHLLRDLDIHYPSNYVELINSYLDYLSQQHFFPI